LRALPTTPNSTRLLSGKRNGINGRIHEGKKKNNYNIKNDEHFEKNKKKAKKAKKAIKTFLIKKGEKNAKRKVLNNNKITVISFRKITTITTTKITTTIKRSGIT